MKREELKSMFDALRHDPQHHLGLGDIRLTVAQQDLILDAIDDPLPPAEGAEAILKEGLDDGRYADIVDGINIDVKQPFYQAIIRYAEDVVAAQQPTAEGAEEIDDETIAWAAEHQCGTPFSERWIGFVKGVKWHRSLHSQRLADKMVSERLREELIKFCRICISAELIGDEIILVDQYLKSKKR